MVSEHEISAPAFQACPSGLHATTEYQQGLCNPPGMDATTSYLLVVLTSVTLSRQITKQISILDCAKSVVRNQLDNARLDVLRDVPQ